jgi:hypothetical protein
MSGLLQQKARCPHAHIEGLEPSDPEKDDNQAQTGHSNGSAICSRGNLENGPNPGFRCLKLIDICRSTHLFLNSLIIWVNDLIALLLGRHR